MEQISEQCARVLALRYETQICQLEDSGVKLLGECGVRRMLESLRTGCLDDLENTTDNTLIVAQLVGEVIHVEKRQGALAIKHMCIPTLSGKSLKWNEQSIFKKPGLKTTEGHYFSAPGCDVAKYGYRYGTAEEAATLGLVRDIRRRPSAIDLNALEEDCGFHAPVSADKRKIAGLSVPGKTNLPTDASPAPPKYVTPSPNKDFTIRTTLKDESSEMAELKATVAAQQSTIDAMNERMAKMEEMMLLMSRKLFPV